MHRRRLLQLMAAALRAGRRRSTPRRRDNRLLVVLRGAYDAASLLVPAASDFYYESRPTIAIRAQAAARRRAAAGRRLGAASRAGRQPDAVLPAARACLPALRRHRGHQPQPLRENRSLDRGGRPPTATPCRPTGSNRRRDASPASCATNTTWVSSTWAAGHPCGPGRRQRRAGHAAGPAGTGAGGLRGRHGRRLEADHGGGHQRIRPHLPRERQQGHRPWPRHRVLDQGGAVRRTHCRPPGRGAPRPCSRTATTRC